MKRTSLPTLIGVFTSLFAIWGLHTFLVVDDCVAQGGTFDYYTANCLLANGQFYDSGIEKYAIALYFVVGFGVSFTVSNLIRKLFKIER